MRTVFINEVQFSANVEVKEEGGNYTAFFSPNNEEDVLIAIQAVKRGDSVEVWYEDVIIWGELESHRMSDEDFSYYEWHMTDVEEVDNYENSPATKEDLDRMFENITQKLDQAKQEAQEALAQSMLALIAQGSNQLVKEYTTADDAGKKTVFTVHGTQIAYSYFNDTTLGYFSYINPAANDDQLAEVLWYCFSHLDSDYLMCAEELAQEAYTAHRQGMGHNAAQHEYANAFAATAAYYSSSKMDSLG